MCSKLTGVIMNMGEAELLEILEVNKNFIIFLNDIINVKYSNFNFLENILAEWSYAITDDLITENYRLIY